MECKSEGHRMHMCELRKRGDMDTFNALSINAMVECDNCGAKAANPENVCNPLELPDIKDVGDAEEIKP